MTLRLKDRLFKTKDDSYVVGQKPNVPILIAIFSMIIALLIGEGTLRVVVLFVALVSILIWAGLELVQGINLFRRLLGSGVLLLALSSLFYYIIML